MRPRPPRITVNHLLHHTSGLSESGYSVLLPADATLEDAVRSLAQAHLTAPVGTKHQYFNLGYDTLATIVEQVSGQRYADYLQDHVFGPLGMASSTAKPDSAAGLAQGYTRLFGFALPMRQIVRDYEIGAGYIVSTAEDLARYAIAMQNGGAGLISPEMVQKMFTPGLDGYGMGWMVGEGGAKIYHGGANETFRTEVNLYPRRDRAFVLLTNEGHQVDHFVSAAQLTGSVEAVVLGQTPPPVEQGLSVRWIGWALGIIVACLASFTHTQLSRSARLARAGTGHVPGPEVVGRGDQLHHPYRDPDRCAQSGQVLLRLPLQSADDCGLLSLWPTGRVHPDADRHVA